MEFGKAELEEVFKVLVEYFFPRAVVIGHAMFLVLSF